LIATAYADCTIATNIRWGAGSRALTDEALFPLASIEVGNTQEQYRFLFNLIFCCERRHGHFTFRKLQRKRGLVSRATGFSTDSIPSDLGPV
jgi:hypothetical protein